MLSVFNVDKAIRADKNIWLVSSFTYKIMLSVFNVDTKP
jgi:hypothetical protein